MFFKNFYKKFVICSTLILVNTLFANPKNPQVVHGKATFNNPSQNALHINTSDKAIINWKDFSISANEITQFIQPNQNSSVLNRVISNNPSELFGTLSANGEVYLLNQNGILIGQNALIDTSTFVASTLNLSDNEFLKSSKLNFLGDSKAEIKNLGTIKASNGNVALIGLEIKNLGTIEAKNGTAALVAAGNILLQPESSEYVFIKPSSIENEQTDTIGIDNSGRIEALKYEIKADGSIYSKAINLSGTISTPSKIVQNEGKFLLVAKESKVDISAKITIKNGNFQIFAKNTTFAKNTKIQANEIILENSHTLINNGTLDISNNENGKINIKADYFLNSGKIIADNKILGSDINIFAKKEIFETSSSTYSSNGKTGGNIFINTSDEGNIFSSANYFANGDIGGKINIFAKNISLNKSTINVDGNFQGGTILIGGDFQGKNENISNADTTQINHTSLLTANATDDGSGGKIIVWSDKVTKFSGKVLACGGKHLGDGGFVEISSKNDLSFSGDVTCSSTNGKNGTFLLDPKNIVIDNASAIYPYYDIETPSAFSSGTGFGHTVKALSNGYIVVTKPNANYNATSAGATFLINTSTGEYISALVGSSASDRVGIDGVTTLSNGHFVVQSSAWSSNKGATTWGNSSTGWGSGSIAEVASGTSGNSIVGKYAGDLIGNDITTLDGNSNYVINSNTWNSNRGSATWVNGANGKTYNNDYEQVSSSNSLVGSTDGDKLTWDGTVALQGNGHYVVASRYWNDTFGSTTWVNGATGKTGNNSSTVSRFNSVLGDVIGALVGIGEVTALTNGNYVISSYRGAGDSGYATWCRGSDGQTYNGLYYDYAIVSPENSLYDSSTSKISEGGIVALSNGHYVVVSPSYNEGTTLIGAVTWCNGTTGTRGEVSSSNSLVGTTVNDRIGAYEVTDASGTTTMTSNSVIALANGHYVVPSSRWSTGKGAITWCNGSDNATTGRGRTSDGQYTISASNSIVGTTVGVPGSSTGDAVGSGGVIALVDTTNYSFVGGSPHWGGDKGAVTWSKGSVGNTTTGAVSSSNSIVGADVYDYVGTSDTTYPYNTIGASSVALSNGHFVFCSANTIINGTEDVGAVTWMNGTTNFTGTVSSSNSLYGSSLDDQVGKGGVWEMTYDGNSYYVVLNDNWSGHKGAVTWCDGSTGIPKGESAKNVAVSSSNSLIGSSANDYVGQGQITTVDNNKYAILSPYYGTSDTGAVSFGDIDSGVVGTLNTQNSIFGTSSIGAPEAVTAVVDQDNSSYNLFAVSFPEASTGSEVVKMALTDPNQLTFSKGPSTTNTIPASFITNTLDTGTSVSIEANNDVTFNSAVSLASPTTTGGAFSVKAGKSVLINQDINLNTEGSISITANSADSSVVTANRESGAGDIAIAAASTINANGADINLTVEAGSSSSATPGNITFADSLSAAKGSIQTSGNGTITLSAPNSSSSFTIGNNNFISSANGYISTIVYGPVTLGENSYLKSTGSGEVTVYSTNNYLALEDNSYIESTTGILRAKANNNIDLNDGCYLKTNSGNLFITSYASNFTAANNSSIQSSSGDISLTAYTDIDMQASAHATTGGGIAMESETSYLLVGNGGYISSTAGDISLLASDSINIGNATGSASVSTASTGTIGLISTTSGITLYPSSYLRTVSGNMTVTASGIIDLYPSSYISYNLALPPTTSGAVNLTSSSEYIRLQDNAYVESKNNDITIIATSVDLYATTSTPYTHIKITGTGDLAVTKSSTTDASELGQNAYIRTGSGTINITETAGGGLSLGKTADISSTSGNIDLSLYGPVPLSSSAYIKTSGTNSVSSSNSYVSLANQSHIDSTGSSVAVSGKMGVSLADAANATFTSYIKSDGTDITDTVTLTSSSETITIGNYNYVQSVRGDITLNSSRNILIGENAYIGMNILTPPTTSGAVNLTSSSGYLRIQDHSYIETKNNDITIIATSVDLDATTSTPYTHIKITGTGDLAVTKSSTTDASELGQNAYIRTGSGTINITETAGGGLSLGDTAYISSTSGNIALSLYGPVPLSSSAYIKTSGTNSVTSYGGITLGTNSYIKSTGSGDVTVRSTHNELALAHSAYIESTSGNLISRASGNVYLYDSSNIKSTSGSLTITSDAGYFVAEDNSYIQSTSGNVALTANQYADLQSSAKITTSGNIDVTASTEYIKVGNGGYISSTAGNINLSANENIDIGNGTGSGYVSTESTGTIDLETTTDGITLYPSSSLRTISGNLTINETAGSGLALDESAFIRSTSGNLALSLYGPASLSTSAYMTTSGIVSLTSSNSSISLANKSTIDSTGNSVSVSGKTGITLADTASAVDSSHIKSSGTDTTDSVTLTSSNGNITIGEYSYILSSYGTNTLSANNSVVFNPYAYVNAPNGNDIEITSTSGNFQLKTSAKLLTTTGDVTISAGNQIILEPSTYINPSTSGNISLTTTSSDILLHENSYLETADSNITLNSGKQITLANTSDNRIKTTGDGNLSLTSSKTSTLGNNSYLEAENGNISVNSGPIILNNSAKIQIVGSGNISLTTNQGSITLNDSSFIKTAGGNLSTTASQSISLDSHAYFQTVSSGTLSLTATNDSIILTPDAYLSSVDGNLLAIAGKNIHLENNTTASTSGSGHLTFVTDNLNPLPNKKGSGQFTIKNATVSTNSGNNLRIFTSERKLNSISDEARFNGQQYVAGAVGIDSSTEQYKTYYSSTYSSKGVPFTIFYKDKELHPHHKNQAADRIFAAHKEGLRYLNPYSNYIANYLEFYTGDAAKEINISFDQAVTTGDIKNAEEFFIRQRTDPTITLKKPDSL